VHVEAQVAVVPSQEQPEPAHRTQVTIEEQGSLAAGVGTVGMSGFVGGLVGKGVGGLVGKGVGGLVGKGVGKVGKGVGKVGKGVGKVGKGVGGTEGGTVVGGVGRVVGGATLSLVLEESTGKDAAFPVKAAVEDTVSIVVKSLIGASTLNTTTDEPSGPATTTARETLAVEGRRRENCCWIEARSGVISVTLP